MRSLSFTTLSVRVAAIAALLLSAAVSRAQQSSVLWTKSALFSAPRAVVSSPDGELVAVIDQDSLVRVWHIRTGDVVGMLARGNASSGRAVHTGARSLPAGAYFVEVLYPNGRISKKALLQDRTD